MKNFMFCVCIVLSTISILLLCLIAKDLTDISNNGRYVMHISPTFRADQYVLDKKEGRLWQLALTKEGELVGQKVRLDMSKDFWDAEDMSLNDDVQDYKKVIVKKNGTSKEIPIEDVKKAQKEGWLISE